MKKNNKFAEIVFFLIFFAFFYINTVTLKDGHNWGDDFGQYLIHAQNLAENLPYASRLNLDAWIICTPGYPILLSLLIKIFGIHFKVYKFLNVIFWYLSILAFYPLFQKHLNNKILSFSILTVFVTSPYFFVFKQSVLSDVPFVFFIVLSFLFYWAYREALTIKSSEISWALFLIAILSMCFASLVRYTGFLLLISVFLYSIYVKDRGNRLVVIFISILIVIAVQKNFNTSILAHAHELSPSRKLLDYGKLFVRNTSYNFAASIVFFLPDIAFLNKPVYSFFMPAVPVLTFVTFLILPWHFILKFKENKLAVEDIFFVIYLLGLCLWPFYQGPRYLLPVIWIMPVIFIELVQRISGLFKNTLNMQTIFVTAMSVLIFFNIISIKNDFNFNDDQIFKPETRELTSWVKENIPPSEHFMFTYPRALGFLTERQGVQCWFASQQPELLPMAIEKFQITYLILFRSDMRIMDFIQQQDLFAVAEAWKNTDFIVYKVKMQKQMRLI